MLDLLRLFTIVTGAQMLKAKKGKGRKS